MEHIPHTQHCPICVRADPVIVAHPTPFRRRFNLRKADLNGYSMALHKLIEDVESIQDKYGCFLENVRVVYRSYIPRGCRTNYIPGLSEESKSMYEDYRKQYASDRFDNSTIDTGDALMDIMKEEMGEDLSNDSASSTPPCLPSANQVLINGRGTMSTKPKRPVLS